MPPEHGFDRHRRVFEVLLWDEAIQHIDVRHPPREAGVELPSDPLDLSPASLWRKDHEGTGVHRLCGVGQRAVGGELEGGGDTKMIRGRGTDISEKGCRRDLPSCRRKNAIEPRWRSVECEEGCQLVSNWVKRVPGVPVSIAVGCSPCIDETAHAADCGLKTISIRLVEVATHESIRMRHVRSERIPHDYCLIFALARVVDVVVAPTVGCEMHACDCHSLMMHHDLCQDRLLACVLT
mmetsp:Transcript_47108/g.121167  ORF Transcript_47108/g.121167 Transcript_47108/m.121167 type:complete len:237 (-) Transcript_47108:455-1165(-)